MVEYQKGVATIRLPQAPTLTELMLIHAVTREFPKILCVFENGWRITVAEVLTLTDYSKSILKIPNKAVFVVEDDTSFGCARMYSSFREDELTKLNVTRDITQGFNWLIDDDDEGKKHPFLWVKERAHGP